VHPLRILTGRLPRERLEQNADGGAPGLARESGQVLSSISLMETCSAAQERLVETSRVGKILTRVSTPYRTSKTEFPGVLE
jgi:hypothetical protein